MFCTLLFATKRLRYQLSKSVFCRPGNQRIHSPVLSLLHSFTFTHLNFHWYVCSNAEGCGEADQLCNAQQAVVDKTQHWHLQLYFTWQQSIQFVLLRHNTDPQDRLGTSLISTKKLFLHSSYYSTNDMILSCRGAFNVIISVYITQLDPEAAVNKRTSIFLSHFGCFLSESKLSYSTKLQRRFVCKIIMISSHEADSIKCYSALQFNNLHSSSLEQELECLLIISPESVFVQLNHMLSMWLQIKEAKTICAHFCLFYLL